jgi:hypothetical protein
LSYFCHGKSYALILNKNVLGYILGDFFTNASGRPGWLAGCRWFVFSQIPNAQKKKVLQMKLIRWSLFEGWLRIGSKYFAFWREREKKMAALKPKKVELLHQEKEVSFLRRRATRLGEF